MDGKLKTRPLGAVASLGPSGFPQVRSATGGELQIVTGPSQAGFNPLDLLYASLAACLAMSARIVANEMGVMHHISHISAAVTGEKAETGLARIARFDVELTIQGEIDDETRAKIAHRAEAEVCTVSNTLQGRPEFVTSVKG